MKQEEIGRAENLCRHSKHSIDYRILLFLRLICTTSPEEYRAIRMELENSTSLDGF